MYEEEYVESFFDNLTGRELLPDLVRQARASELEFIQELGVWKIVPRHELPEGTVVVKGRWVDINKGDADRPNYRSRYVAKEIKKGSKGSLVAEFFAAMPPLSCSKLLLILAMCDRIPDSQGNLCRPPGPLCISFIDVKRAHFMSPARRSIAVELPPELRREGHHEVGLLQRELCMAREMRPCVGKLRLQIFWSSTWDSPRDARAHATSTTPNVACASQSTAMTSRPWAPSTPFGGSGPK